MIYWVEENDDSFLSENIPSLKGKEFNTFVWKNQDNSLGFFKEELSDEFVKKLIIDKNSITIVFPHIISIQDDATFEDNKYRLRGVSFFGNVESVKSEYKKLISNNLEVKKNKIKERNGREPKPIKWSSIRCWYKDNTYTEEFVKFCINEKLEYIIWSYSEFGIYFYQFKEFYNIEKRVKYIAKELNIPMTEVPSLEQMPYY